MADNADGYRGLYVRMANQNAVAVEEITWVRGGRVNRLEINICSHESNYHFNTGVMSS